MKHVRAINRKAVRIEHHGRAESDGNGQAASGAPASGGAGANGDTTGTGAGPSATPKDVVGLESRGPHIPLGCSLVFSPGWEADSSGGTAGLCQPVERDLFDCHYGCFWPVQVPDQLNHSPDWTGKCAAAQKDWRKIDLIFP